MNVPEDPFVLLSFINTKLRDEYASLDDLCEDLDINKGELLGKLESIGFNYDSMQNRFW